MSSVLAGVNPRTGTATPAVTVTSETEAAAQVAAAEAAAHCWAATPHGERAALLRRVADELDRLTEPLVSAAEDETALGRPRLENEVRRTTGQLRLYAEEVAQGHHLRIHLTEADPAAGVPDLRRMQVARGPVVVFAAGNFPFAFSVAGGDSASALAAGCPVVVKAHENHPHTSELVADVLRRVLPTGVFGLVHGRAAGRVAVTHPACTAVGFTGSLQGGLVIQELCRRRPVPIPFFGELSSVNPVVVMPDLAETEAERLAEAFLASMTLGNGQFCTKPGLLFVPEGSGLVETVASTVRDSTAGPLLTSAIRDHYRAPVDLPLLAAGSADRAAFAVPPEVRLVESVAFAAALPILTRERFGPAAVVVTYTSQEDLLGQLRQLPGALVAAVHSGAPSPEVDAVASVLRRRVGRLVYNSWPTGVAVSLAQHHGGPYPATTSDAHTSVGQLSIDRWMVPIAYQDWPDELLPPELQRANPQNLPRRRR